MSQLTQIPEELKSYAQWVVWKAVERDGKTTKVPYSPKTGRPASVTNPADWTDFDSAMAVQGYYSGIGFVLTKDDPYVCIDLDPTEDKDVIDSQEEIFRTLDSYSEISPSGKGLHIFVKGNVPAGRKKKGVEIYPHERYITMTGNVFHPAPIRSVNGELHYIYESLGDSQKTVVEAPIETVAELSDERVLELARMAANSTKFDLSYDGKWEAGGYPSASESDYALVNILYFHSRNKEQTKRLFLASPAGHRDKYKKSRNDYHINRMIAHCHDFLPPEIDLSEFEENAKALLGKVEPEPETHTEVVVAPVTVEEDVPDVRVDQFFPEGLLGDLAQFFYDQAPHPIKEVALAGAMGLLAGVVGRAYNYHGQGLNMYIALIAESGMGKDAAKTGRMKIAKALEGMDVNLNDFIGPSRFTSATSVLGHFTKSETKSMLMHIGELGLYMQQINNPKGSSSDKSIVSTLLDIYTASSEGCMHHGVTFSDHAKSIPPIPSPALSVLGDTTPSEFFKGITDQQLDNGLMSRLTIIEYIGDFVPYNENHYAAQVPTRVLHDFASLVVNCKKCNVAKRVAQVGSTHQADARIRKFREEVDDLCRKRKGDLGLSLFRRMGQKVDKLSALIAVGRNPYDPRVELRDVEYAIDFVANEVNGIMGHVRRGDVRSETPAHTVATGATSVIITEAIKVWFAADLHSVDKKMAAKGVIPRRWLQRRTSAKVNSSAFIMTIKDMISNGMIVELTMKDKVELVSAGVIKRSQMNGDMYGVIDLSEG